MIATIQIGGSMLFVKNTRNKMKLSYVSTGKAQISIVHSIILRMVFFVFWSLNYPTGTLKISISATLTSAQSKFVVQSLQIQRRIKCVVAVGMNLNLPLANQFTCALPATSTSNFIRNTTNSWPGLEKLDLQELKMNFPALRTLALQASRLSMRKNSSS